MKRVVRYSLDVSPNMRTEIVDGFGPCTPVDLFLSCKDAGLSFSVVFERTLPNGLTLLEERCLGHIHAEQIGGETEPDREIFESLAREEVRGATEEVFVHRLFWRFFVEKTDSNRSDVLAELFPKLRAFYDRHLEKLK